MTVLLVILHVIISIFLILVVLIQQGKGADLAGAFGGGVFVIGGWHHPVGEVNRWCRFSTCC